MRDPTPYCFVWPSARFQQQLNIGVCRQSRTIEWIWNRDHLDLWAKYLRRCWIRFFMLGSSNCCGATVHLRLNGQSSDSLCLKAPWQHQCKLAALPWKNRLRAGCVRHPECCSMTGHLWTVSVLGECNCSLAATYLEQRILIPTACRRRC